jgi:hypothetical protein
METPVSGLPPELAEVLDLGVFLGHNQAFALVASRCSAAQAEGLWRLRQEEKYKRLTPHWRDFCSQYLKISGSEADRIIQHWVEFGSEYFDMAQITRIAPYVYRALAPSIKGGALHVNGEAIALNASNASKLAEAVAEMRRSLPPKKPSRPLAMPEHLAELDKRCTALITEFEEISRTERTGENRPQLTATLSRLASALKRLELENGME